jgi:hypothetical protein
MLIIGHMLLEKNGRNALQISTPWRPVDSRVTSVLCWFRLNRRSIAPEAGARAQEKSGTDLNRLKA